MDGWLDIGWSLELKFGCWLEFVGVGTEGVLLKRICEDFCSGAGYGEDTFCTLSSD